MSVFQPETIFLGAAVLSMLVSVLSVGDAWLTLRAFNRSDRAADPNSRLVARAGIRSASIRVGQMACLLEVGRIAHAIQPRPSTAEALEVAWWLLALVCVLSSVPELLAMWDRRHIVPDWHPERHA
jgi:hypothetical protein